MSEITQLAAVYREANRKQQKEMKAAAREGMKRARRALPKSKLFSDRGNDWYLAADLGVSLAVARLIGVHNEKTRAALTDRSPEATEARHHALVDALCSGTRCSLRRAYKLAAYGKHNPSLAGLLTNRGIRARFQWNIDQGKLPAPKYRPHVLAALGIDPIVLQEDMELLGLVPP